MDNIAEGSWRVTETAPQLLHLLLYIRDALILPRSQAEDEPPRLTPPAPIAADTYKLQPYDHARWIRWWQDVTLTQAKLGLSPRSAGADSTWSSLLRELEHAGEPPFFAGLADAPSLRNAAIDLYERARKWTRALPDADLTWSREEGWLARGVIEEILAEEQQTSGVAANRANVAVIILHVEGIWWRAHSPGVVLLSVDAASHPESSRQAIRAAWRQAI